MLSLASAFFLRPKVNATFNLHPFHVDEESNKKSLLKRGNTRDFETQTINEAVLTLARQLADEITPLSENNNDANVNVEVETRPRRETVTTQTEPL